MAGLTSPKPTAEDTEAFARYLAATSAAFERAAAQVGERRILLDLVGEVVCLRFAGALAGKMIPAFAHLESRSGQPPSLTILCWDSTSTGTPLAPPPWPPTAYGLRGHILGWNDDDMRAAYQPGAQILNLL
jgi:hypothetical protein